MARRFRSFPLILIAVLVILMDLYVFQGLKVLISASGEGMIRAVSIGYFSGSLLVLCSLFWLISRFRTAGKMTWLFNSVFNIFITLFVTKLTFILAMAAGDIYRIAAALVRLATGAASDSLLLPRSVLWCWLALILSAIPFFSFIFGVTRGKYHYKVHRKTIFFDDLPESFDGFTITQISDIHAGSFNNRKAVEKGIALINAQRSDLFVFTGDLVNNEATEVLPWIPVFKEIEAVYGKFSVLGNHDYGDYIAWKSYEDKATNLDTLKRYHAGMGFRLLLDEHVRISRGGEQIALAGVENWGVGFGHRGDLRKALKGIDERLFKILLSHDPSHWDAEVKEFPVKVHLTLSGHTHGMQFGIEVFGFKWSPIKLRYPNWAGLASENGRYLYVNRGFGFLGFSGRVGIWPEITVITLRRKGY